MDDWTFAAGASRALREGAIVTYALEPLGQHWSPLWQAFDVANIWLVGWSSDLLIRSLTAALAVGSLWLFLHTARQLGMSLFPALCGSVVLALHPLNAAPYYSFDCYSQMYVDLSSWYIASVLLVRVSGRGEPRASSPLILTCIFAIALAAKEQALAAWAMVAVLALWFHAVAPVSTACRLLLRRVWAGFTVVAVVFTLLRLAAGVSLSGTEEQQVCVSCVPANVAAFVVGTIHPMRAMPVYFAVLDPTAHPLRLLMAAVSIVAVAAALWAGIRALYTAGRPEARYAVLFAGLIVASAFPTALLSRVGELHAHTGLFWFAMLVATAAEGWRRRLSGATWPRPALATAALLLYWAALLVGLRANLSDMRDTGIRAARLQARFRQAVSALPEGSVILVRGLERVRAPGDYGLYRLTTPGVLLLDPKDSLALGTGDRFRIVDEESWREVTNVRSGAPAFAVTFIGDAVSLEVRAR